MSNRVKIIRDFERLTKNLNKGNKDIEIKIEGRDKLFNGLKKHITRLASKIVNKDKLRIILLNDLNLKETNDDILNLWCKTKYY